MRGLTFQTNQTECPRCHISLPKLMLLAHCRTGNCVEREKGLIAEQVYHTLEVSLDQILKDIDTPEESFTKIDETDFEVKKRKIQVLEDTDDDMLSCPVCAEPFYDQTELERHQAKSHSQSHAFSCSVCGHKAPSERELVVHKAMQHTQEKPNCPDCGLLMSNGHKCLKKEELVLEKGPDPFESLERSLEMQKSRQDPLKCIKCGERLGGKDLKAHYNSCWSNKFLVRFPQYKMTHIYTPVCPRCGQTDSSFVETRRHCKTCTLDVFSYICHCGQSLKSYQEYLEHHKKHPYLGPDTPAPNRATRQRRESEMRVDSDTSVSVSSDSEPETMPKPKKRTSVEADKQVSRTPSVEANKQVSRTPSVEFIKTETPVRSGKFQQAVPKIVVKEQKPVQKEESPVKKEQKLTPLQKSTKFVFSDETPAAKDIKSSPKSLKRTKAAVKELPPNVVKVDVSPTAQVELNERDPRKRIMDEREMVWWEEDQDEKYCKLCHVELHSQKESDAHVAEHTLQYRDLVLYSKDLECRRCTFVGSNQTELKQHVKTCDKTTFMPYWLCRTCVAPVTFTNAAEYNQHIYYHHHELMMFRVARSRFEEMLYEIITPQCPVCKEDFQVVDQVVHHFETCPKKKTFKKK